MSKKVLIATEKPFAPAARDRVVSALESAAFEVKVLEKYTDKSALLEAVKEVNALIVRSDKVTPEVMDAAPGLELVVRAGAGYDNIDCQEARKRQVVVMNTPGQNANAVAELVIGLMIMMVRGKFNGKPGTELRGKTLGLQGFGNVGRFAAKYLSECGYKVAAVSDSKGVIHSHDSKGLDFKKLEGIKDRTGSVTNYRPADTDYHDHILEVEEADILITAAVPDLIRSSDVKRVKYQLIIEGSNIPMTHEVEQAWRGTVLDSTPLVAARGAAPYGRSFSPLAARRRHRPRSAPACGRC